MKFRITSAAAVELTEAVEYYRGIEHALAVRFLREFESVVERICRFPESGHAREKYRFVLIRGFPYGVTYNMAKEEIIIEAVPHLKRGPEYWMELRKRT